MESISPSLAARFSILRMESRKVPSIHLKKSFLNRIPIVGAGCGSTCFRVTLEFLTKFLLGVSVFGSKLLSNLKIKLSSITAQGWFAGGKVGYTILREEAKIQKARATLEVSSRVGAEDVL